MRIYLYIFLFAMLPGLLPISAPAATPLPDGIIRLDNSQAINFTVSDYDGKSYSLAQSQGKWVFLHFWASWCGPCRHEMPKIADLVRVMAGKPIDIVLINTAEDEDTIFSFLASVAPQLHSYMDKDGLLTNQWAPRGLPTTYFIDPEGRRRYLALGGRPWDQAEYRTFIQALLDQK